MLVYCYKDKNNKMIEGEIPEFIYFEEQVLKFNRKKSAYCEKCGKPRVPAKKYINNLISNNKKVTIAKYGKKDLDITMLLIEGAIFNEEKDCISYINGEEVLLSTILLNSEPRNYTKTEGKDADIQLIGL